MIKTKRNAFTLAEMLIVMGLLGTICAALMPTIQSIQPNQNKILLRKGYNVIERTVNLLINNDDLYPNDTAFADATYGGPLKFCQNFQDSLNMISFGNCPTTGGPVFIGTTPDGIEWYYTAGEFTQTASAFNNIVLFDVNGSSKPPNCSSFAAGFPSGYSTCEAGKSPDLFKVGIRWDGKVHMGGAMNETDAYAAEVLSSITNNLNN